VFILTVFSTQQRYVSVERLGLDPAAMLLPSRIP